MVFQNPAMLWALPAVALPVLIHLINRSRYRVVHWAAMEHLMSAKKRVRRRVLMENWLLLIIRTLLVLLLVLALARPDLEGTLDARGDADLDWVVLIDNSTSLEHTPGQQSAKTRLREELAGWLEQLRDDRPQDRVSFVLASKPGEILSALRRVAPTAAEIDSVRQKLEAVTPIDRPVDPAVAMETSFETLVPGIAAEDQRPVLVLWASDFRFPDWRAPRRLRDAAEGFAGVELLDAGFADSDNTAVVNLTCLDARPLANVPARFEITVRRWGAAAENLPLTLHIIEPLDDPGTGSPVGTGDATERDVESLSPIRRVPLAPIPWVPGDGRETRHVFGAALPSPGATVIGVSIEADDYTPDDVRWLSLTVAPELRVLLVDGKPGPRDFTGAADYMQLALEPDPSDPMGMAVTPIDYDDMAGYPLANFDVVVFANMDRIEPEVVEQLCEFVDNGGGVAFFLGDEADPAAWALVQEHSAMVLKERIGGDARLSLFPAELVTMRTATREQPMRLQVEQPNHPLMEVFAGAEGLGLLAETVRIEKSWELTATDPKTVICSVADDAGIATPMVITSHIGRGHSVIVALPGDATWSTWPRTPSFPIFVHTLVTTLAPSDEIVRSLTVGGGIRREWTADEFSPDVFFVGPGVDENVSGEMTPGTAGIVFEWPAVESAGRYVLGLQGRSGEAILEQYAVNRDPIESDLRPVEMTALAAETGWRVADTARKTDLLDASDAGTSLARLLFAIIGILLVLDVLLGTVSARRRAAS